MNMFHPIIFTALLFHCVYSHQNANLRTFDFANSVSSPINANFTSIAPAITSAPAPVATNETCNKYGGLSQVVIDNVAYNFSDIAAKPLRTRLGPDVRTRRYEDSPETPDRYGFSEGYIFQMCGSPMNPNGNEGSYMPNGNGAVLWNNYMDSDQENCGDTCDHGLCLFDRWDSTGVWSKYDRGIQVVYEATRYKRKLTVEFECDPSAGTVPKTDSVTGDTEIYVYYPKYYDDDTHVLIPTSAACAPPSPSPVNPSPSPDNPSPAPDGPDGFHFSVLVFFILEITISAVFFVFGLRFRRVKSQQHPNSSSQDKECLFMAEEPSLFLEQPSALPLPDDYQPQFVSNNYHDEPS